MPQKNSNPKVGPSPGTDIESDFESFINGGAGAPLTKSRVDTLYDQHVQQTKPQDIESDFANFQAQDTNGLDELKAGVKDRSFRERHPYVTAAMDVVQHPIENAPVIGATIGSFVGGPAKAASKLTGVKFPNLAGATGAALGGAAGEGVRQVYDALFDPDTLLKENPTASPTDIIQKMLTSGAEQGAYDLAGRKLVNTGGTLVRGGKRLYESALKPAKSVLEHSAAYGRGGEQEALDTMMSTGLNERIPISRDGLEKIDRITDQLNARIATKVQRATGTIPANGPVLDPARAVVEDFAKDPTSPEMANRARQVLENFLNANSVIAKTPTNFATGQVASQTSRFPVAITAPAAQEQKQAIYRGLKATAYGERKGGETEAKKAVARGLKGELERVADVGPENQRESNLLFLRDAMEDAVRRTGNKNILSLGDYLALIAATGHGAGAMLPGGMSPGAAFAASLGQRPAIASPLAFGMNRVGRALNVNPKAARTLLEAGRSPTAQMIQDFLSEN